MTTKPKVSLVMCTRNRAAFLDGCLQALIRLKADVPFELVLVDNGSTDNTATILAEFASQQKMPVVLVSEPLPGVSQGRNAGIKAASGDVIAFTDDDCYPAENFLTAVLACFADKNLGYLGGRVLLFDPADLPITIQTLNRTLPLPPHEYMSPGLIHGANFSFRREVLDRIGGFDKHLGSGTPCMAADDTDLLQRASVAGFAGLYSPGPVVHHHHRRQTAQDEQRILRAYAISRGAYFFKGLCSTSARRLFYWPVLRRFCGHLVYFRIKTLFFECRGAMNYYRSTL
ncbi:MAG TPA: glycosyltransferase family 2 protein [Rhodoferax sp.]